MNMSNVKAISTEVVVNNTLYRKGVKQIKDSNNNVLWSYTSGWTTIWEGNKTFTVYGDSPYATENICHGIYDNASNPQYRLTFSFNYNAPSGATIYYVNPSNPDFVTTTPTTSPVTITTSAGMYHDYVRLLYLGIDNGPDASIFIDQVGNVANNGVNNIWFVGGGTQAVSPSYYASITLTKIEQYIA